MEGDKLELLPNQMALMFFGLLAAMEHHSHEEWDRRVPFPSFTISSWADIVVETPIENPWTKITNTNDGSFYIESKSTRRMTEWVGRENMPQASLEV